MNEPKYNVGDKVYVIYPFDCESKVEYRKITSCTWNGYGWKYNFSYPSREYDEMEILTDKSKAIDKAIETAKKSLETHIEWLKDESHISKDY